MVEICSLLSLLEIALGQLAVPVVTGQVIELITFDEARPDEDRDPIVDGVVQAARGACELSVPLSEIAMAAWADHDVAQDDSLGRLRRRRHLSPGTRQGG